ncbi:MAG: hypothetical protein ACJA04_000866 [Cellvibrionaceae bacterium]|jgi:hypothetical protein
MCYIFAKQAHLRECGLSGQTSLLCLSAPPVHWTLAKISSSSITVEWPITMEVLHHLIGFYLPSSLT